MALKWKPPAVLKSHDGTVSAAPISVEAAATTPQHPPPASKRLPKYVPERENQALQNERVEMTPGGSRKHVLTCTTPGGTMRTASYTSPSTAVHVMA